MSKSWEGGSTTAWRRTRRMVMDRDGWACQLRLDGCTGRAEHAHHTHGRNVTGDDPRFIVAACPSCNLKTGQPQGNPPPEPPRTQW